MRDAFVNKIRTNNKKGFSLIEVLMVITIIGVLVLIAVPSLIGFIERAKELRCHTNTLQLERLYYTTLVMESTEHTEVLFDQYLQEIDVDICPGDGNISNVGGKVQCSIHPRDDEEGGGNVPFL